MQGLLFTPFFMLQGSVHSSDTRAVQLAKNASIFALGVAGLSAFYKIPKWIDSYYLGFDTQRSTRDNIISLLSRTFAGNVVGTFIGEYFIRMEHNQNSAITDNSQISTLKVAID